MATLVLAVAGQAIGGFFGLGGVGTMFGKAAGALAGGFIDRSLFGGSSPSVETGKLADVSIQSSNEGASLSRVYGRVRLAGQVIWATNFEEVVSTEEQGGKGIGGGSKTSVTSYSYFANFAVALCEGEIARVGRVWADGKVLDTRQINMRVYHGSADQIPDPLISAFQSTAPAYRGTAYVAFERLALEQFGNRLPQLSFEVIRPVEPLETQIRAVTIIPGAGEFVYSPVIVSEVLGPGSQRPLNRHVEAANSDWAESLDELQSLCPNLKRVALVVAWFGDDLRADHCTVRPKVEDKVTTTDGGTWSVAGLNRASALEVSKIDGRPAYGGTPSDASVIAAIQDLKARGLEVMLYPFLLMDVPPANALPDPYGGNEQAAFPWRGRIVPVGDVATAAQSFFGTTSAGDFTVSGQTVSYSGPAEWYLRRQILHLSALAKAAGGVESILIGSELRGLTQAHAGGGTYPFVDQLKSLAIEVRSLVGPDVNLSYAADWSEYGSHQVSGTELRFPLDPLWAASEIDFIGIDNYLPLTDVRDYGGPDDTTNPFAIEDLRAGIAGGEYHDWYYASEADRRSGLRSPITDGAYDKPWVYRAKDLKGWWQNQHVERVAGSELGFPTDWQAMSKPIRFTELGFPAVDRGSNQPNVFVDPKSSESALPHFSRGTRDDVNQRRALEAHLSWWSNSHPDFPAGDNPLSLVYGGQMVDPDGIYLWTWDARPYPAFPVFGDVWADGGNWQFGHWLNGRLAGLSLQGLIKAVLDDYGISKSDVQVRGLAGGFDGYTLSGPVSARDVIEPLLVAFSGNAADRGTHIEISSILPVPVTSLQAADLVESGQSVPVFSRVRAQASELPVEIRLSGDDPSSEFRRRLVASRRLEGGSRQIDSLGLPITGSVSVLQLAAEKMLYRIWSERERIEFSLGPDHIRLDPGDVISLTGMPEKEFESPLLMRIEAVEDRDSRRIEAVRIAADLVQAGGGTDTPEDPFKSVDLSLPIATFLDLPKLSDSDPEDALRLAAFAEPWPGNFSVMRSAGNSGFTPLMSLAFPAVMGELTQPLDPGPLWIFDRKNTIELKLYSGQLESRSEANVLAGANALAIECQAGGYEILQFHTAELNAPNSYRLTKLLRGQRGTEPEMLQGAAVGAMVVVLSEDRVPLVPMTSDQSGLSLNYQVVPPGRALDDPASLALSHASTVRAARPLAPVHLRARRGPDGIHLAWIRQTRQGGENWEQVDVPLSEEREAYEVDILSGQTVVRTITSEIPTTLYPVAEELTDFGSPVSELNICVGQVSQRIGRGPTRKATLHV